MTNSFCHCVPLPLPLPLQPPLPLLVLLHMLLSQPLPFPCPSNYLCPAIYLCSSAFPPSSAPIPALTCSIALTPASSQHADSDGMGHFGSLMYSWAAARDKRGFVRSQVNLQFFFLYPLFITFVTSFRGIMKQFGNHVARIAIVFMLFSTGMFISAAGRYSTLYGLVKCLMINPCLHLNTDYDVQRSCWFSFPFSFPSQYICHVHGAVIIWWMVCRKQCSNISFLNFWISLSTDESQRHTC